MTNEEMLSHVDHTQLKAFATWEEIKELCDEAVKYKTASVCIPPTYIKKIKETYKDTLVICTVVGFPLGYSVIESKVEETKIALKDGATEIDMVINLCDVKNCNYEKVENEIRTLKEIVGSNVLKVIIEACYLTEEEKIKLCEIITKAGADYIKTSTGFGTGGAKMDDILLFKKHIGPNVFIKAAGGISTVTDLEAFLNAGCNRIGTSRAVGLLKD